MPSPLRLVSSPSQPSPTEEETLVERVLEVRRRLARRMRASQLAGLDFTDWSQHMMSQLAHADAVTSRYVRAPSPGPAPEVERALASLTAVHAWMFERLGVGAQQSLRRHELRVRLETSQLANPLLRLEVSAGSTPDHEPVSPALPHSLRAGLDALDDGSLQRIAVRLGIRHELMGRRELQQRLASILCDPDLQQILLSTLSDPAQALLVRLVRTPNAAAAMRSLANAVRERVPGPADELHRCGLLFAGESGGELVVWVPSELRRPLDELLRGSGW